MPFDPRRLGLLSAGLLLLSVLQPALAGADVIVLTDGSRVETSGAFEVTGSQVEFTDRQGRWSALRLADVDLEASREATRSAAKAASATADAVVEPSESGATERPAPVLTLTNRDIGTASPDVLSAEAEAATAEDPQVILYTTSWCGYCRKARSLLDKLGVSYVEHDVERNPEARRDKQRKSPRCGVPVTDVAGEVVCGFNEQRLRRLIESLPSANDAGDGEAVEGGEPARTTR